MTSAVPFSRLVPTASEFRTLAGLALPVVVVQVGLVFQGVVDTLMVGRVSAADLAAVALGNLYFFAVSVFGMGVLFALDPLISQAFGADDHEGIELGIQRGLLLSLGLSLGASVALSVAPPILTLLRQPPEVIPVASGYAWALIPGMVPFYGFVVFRQSLQAVGRVAPIVVTILLANGVNAVANWLPHLRERRDAGHGGGRLGLGYVHQQVVHAHRAARVGQKDAGPIPAARAA